MGIVLELPLRASVEINYEALKQEKINIKQAPCTLDFGYALTLLAPDGHRIRFYYLEHKE